MLDAMSSNLHAHSLVSYELLVSALFAGGPGAAPHYAPSISSPSLPTVVGMFCRSCLVQNSAICNILSKQPSIHLYAYAGKVLVHNVAANVRSQGHAICSDCSLLKRVGKRNEVYVLRSSCFCSRRAVGASTFQEGCWTVRLVADLAVKAGLPLLAL